MMKRKEVLWLVPESSEKVAKISAHLATHNYHSVILDDVPKVSNYLNENRVSLIIICDSSIPSDTEKNLVSLTNLPEAKGARCVYTYNDHNDKLLETAICHNFRELVPLDLSIDMWLYRALYASTSLAANFPLPPNCVTLDHPIQLSFPGRIIWINKKNIRIECHLNLPVGRSAKINGNIFGQDDSHEINFHVKKVEKQKLYYRFSSVLEGTWDSAHSDHHSIIENIKSSKKYSKTPKYRVFIAIKNKEVRKKILDFFSFDHFDCNSALHMKSLVFEPLYYTPHMIVIEEDLCYSKYAKSFIKMMSSVSIETPIIILGKNPSLRMILQNYPNHKFINIQEYNFAKFSEMVGKYLPNLNDLEESHPYTFYIDPQEESSNVMIQIPGKAHSINPNSLTISSNYKVSQFSIIEALSPLLKSLYGTHPFLKVIKSQIGKIEQNRHTFFYNCYIMNIGQQNRHHIAKSICNYLAKSIGAVNVDTNYILEMEERKKVFQLENAHSIDESSESANQLNDFSMGSRYTLKDTSSFRYQKRHRPDFELQIQRYLKIFMYILISFILGFEFFDRFLPMLSKNYSKSGSVYIDQLNKYRDNTLAPKN